MATANTIKEQLVKKEDTKKNLTPVQQKYNRVSTLLEKMQGEIAKALPKHITPDRLSRIALTSIRNNPKLLECSEVSLLGAILQSAQMGLEPNTPSGEAYLIPFKNKGQMEVQFQIGYRGLISMFYRSEQSLNIDAHEVYENDEFQFEYGIEAKLVHKPTLKDRGKVIAYYAVAKMKNGAYAFVVMSKEDIEEHAGKYSQAYKNGWTSPWKTDFDEMAKKTCIKKLMKYLPISPEIQRINEADNAVVKYEDGELENEFVELNVDQETGEILGEA